MLYPAVFITSISTAFLGHYLIESRVKSWELRLGKYHIHHSFFGAIFLALALFEVSGIFSIIFAGYGIGNIWQHKYAHNKQGEKGMVFISKN